MTNALIAELEQEAATTRRVLERVPEDQLSWAPHPRSMTLGQLAYHIAVLPQAITGLVSELTAPVPNVPLPEAGSVAEVLETLEESIRVARERLSAWSEEDMRQEWRMVNGEETILAVPRGGMLRAVMLNHWYHHRGQLTVYLRLLDVSVPSVYGPTADEKVFA